MKNGWKLRQAVRGENDNAINIASAMDREMKTQLMDGIPPAAHRRIDNAMTIPAAQAEWHNRCGWSHRQGIKKAARSLLRAARGWGNDLLFHHLRQYHRRGRA